MYYNGKLLPGTKGEFEFLFGKPNSQRLRPHCTAFTPDKPGYNEIVALVAEEVYEYLENWFSGRSIDILDEVVDAYNKYADTSRDSIVKDDHFWMLIHGVIGTAGRYVTQDNGVELYVVITRLYEGSTIDITAHNNQVIERYLIDRALIQIENRKAALGR